MAFIDVVRAAVRMAPSVAVGERCSEQTWLVEGEVDVALPGRAEARDGPLGCGSVAGHGVQPRQHRLSQSALGVLGDRGKQRVAIGVVAVGRRIADPRHPLHVPQHHRVRAARAGEFHGAVQENLTQVAVVVGVGGGAGGHRKSIVSMLTILTSAGVGRAERAQRFKGLSRTGVVASRASGST